MSARTDHAAIARDVVVEMGYPFETTDLLRHSQVHATLALVEQQRIANLIALSQATNPDGSRVMPTALTHVVDEYSVGVNIEIREGLGL